VVEKPEKVKEVVVTKNRRRPTKTKIVEPKVEQTTIEQPLPSSEEN
jgi:hypothetical protein